MTLAMFLTTFAEPDVLTEEEQAYQETLLKLREAVQEYPEEAKAWSRWNAALPPAPDLKDIPLARGQKRFTNKEGGTR